MAHGAEPLGEEEVGLDPCEGVGRRPHTELDRVLT